MKVKRFVLCLFMLTLIGGICFISCGNTSKAKAESDVAAETAEETFPFTQEKWPLLDAETLKEERITQEEGGIYVSKFTVNEPTHKEFEAGYEESEVDLRVIFDLIDGKWYVTDCYTGWYGYDLPIDDLNETVKQVKEENDTFKELHP